MRKHKQIKSVQSPNAISMKEKYFSPASTHGYYFSAIHFSCLLCHCSFDQQKNQQMNAVNRIVKFTSYTSHLRLLCVNVPNDFYMSSTPVRYISKRQIVLCQVENSVLYLINCVLIQSHFFFILFAF